MTNAALPPKNTACLKPDLSSLSVFEATRPAAAGEGFLLLWGKVMSTNRDGHIRLTSHPGHRTPGRFPIRWGAPTARERGPVIGTVNAGPDRNAIGAHGGSYALYRALAVSSGALNPIARPDLHDTSPVVDIGPFPQWGEAKSIVSLDPWGHRVAEDFKTEIAEGIDIRPTIAITKARLTVPEFDTVVGKGMLKVDGDIVQRLRAMSPVTKAAIDPVWYLPGIAERFNVSEDKLRAHAVRADRRHVSGAGDARPDISVFLPPIGGMTLYIFGDPAFVGNPQEDAGLPRARRMQRLRRVRLGHLHLPAVSRARHRRMHQARRRMAAPGLIVYNRKEGRALGEVTKFLVYNARKRQPGGDQAATYFERTECVAGVQDARFQQLMPDVLHWLGITRIDRFVSMSNMKYDAVVGSGIDIVERIPIPDGLIPDDAKVEMEAKKAAGYFTPEGAPTEDELKATVGRDLRDF